MIRDLKADVPVQLRKDVLQGGRRRHAALHGEAQPVCLSLAMVRILSQDDGLHLVIRGVFQCVEDVIHVWIDTLMRIFIGEESPELLIIVFLEFICEQLIPFIADVYHVVFLLSLSVVFLFIIHENALEKRTGWIYRQRRRSHSWIFRSSISVVFMLQFLSIRG